MKKALGICITALATITLAGCQSKMSQSELKDSFTNVSNSVAKELNVITDYRNGKLSESELNSKLDSSAESAIKVSNREIKKLDNNASDKKNTNKLIAYAKDSKSFATDLKDGSKHVNKSIVNVSNDEKNLKRSLNATVSSKFKTAVIKFNKAQASQPHVSGNTAYFKGGKIEITGSELMPASEVSDTNTPQIVIHYKFTNNSGKALEPYSTLVGVCDITQENKTSITDLNTSIGTADSWDSAHPNYYTLEKVGQDEAKNGATVESVAAYQLDNTTYPVKLKFTDPDTGQSIGTIKLDVN